MILAGNEPEISVLTIRSNILFRPRIRCGGLFEACMMEERKIQNIGKVGLLLGC
jgi:hypothetical protein